MNHSKPLLALYERWKTITQLCLLITTSLFVGASPSFAQDRATDADAATEVMLIVNNNGREALAYRSMRGVVSGKFLLPANTSASDFSYAFPGNYDILREGENEVLDFHSSSYAMMKNETISQDEHGVYSFRHDNQFPGGHHGYNMGGVGHNYHQFAFVFVLPSQFEIVNYRASCLGKWTQKDAVLSLFATDVNDVDVEVQFRERPEVIQHDTVIARCEELQRLYDKLAEDHRKDSTAREDVVNKLRSSASAGGDNVQIVNTASGVNITLAEKLLFASGNATVSPDGIKVVNALAEKIRTFDQYHVVVSGHTDNVPITKHNQYLSNWGLSSARAANVSQLLADDGLPESVMEIHAFGSTKPKATNDTPQGRASNRRIEIEVIKN
jgi:flagellar motor protein MotB